MPISGRSPISLTCREGNPWQGNDFKECRTSIGWTRAHLADLIGCSHRMIQIWEDGHNAQRPNSVYSIPDDVATYMETIASVHRSVPKPRWNPAKGRPKKRP